MEGPEERRLEGEDGLQMGTHTQTCYWPHKVSVRAPLHQPSVSIRVNVAMTSDTVPIENNDNK